MARRTHLGMSGCAHPAALAQIGLFWRMSTARQGGKSSARTSSRSAVKAIRQQGLSATQRVGGERSPSGLRPGISTYLLYDAVAAGRPSRDSAFPLVRGGAVRGAFYTISGDLVPCCTRPPQPTGPGIAAGQSPLTESNRRPSPDHFQSTIPPPQVSTLNCEKTSTREHSLSRDQRSRALVDTRSDTHLDLANEGVEQADPRSVHFNKITLTARG